jgi:ribosomal protein L14E/L6E/L27E
VRAERNVVLGQLVTSNAGRDCGRNFVVVGMDSPPFIKVVDGRSRSIDKPKRKNVRHVKIHDSVALSLAQKLQESLRVTNEEIRQAITYFIEPDND